MKRSGCLSQVCSFMWPDCGFTQLCVRICEKLEWNGSVYMLVILSNLSSLLHKIQYEKHIVIRLHTIKNTFNF